MIYPCIIKNSVLILRGLIIGCMNDHTATYNLSLKIVFKGSLSRWDLL